MKEDIVQEVIQNLTGSEKVHSIVSVPSLRKVITPFIKIQNSDEAVSAMVGASHVSNYLQASEVLEYLVNLRKESIDAIVDQV